MIHFFLNNNHELSCKIENEVFEKIYLKKSFPLDKMNQSIAVFSESKTEIAWLVDLLSLSDREVLLIKHWLEKNSPIKYVQNILNISSLAFPNIWCILVKGERILIQIDEQEDLLHYPEYGTLIKDSIGSYYLIPDTSQLDKSAQKILSAFIL